MKNAQFNEIVSTQLIKIEETLISKGSEYATDHDRLHNFKQAAALQKIDPRDALAGMMIKHTVSIYDMVGDTSGSHSMAKWDEKITDHITYLVLLKAVIEEEYAEAEAAAKLAGFPSVEAQKATEHRDGVRDTFVSNVTFAPLQELESTPINVVPEDELN